MISFLERKGLVVEEEMEEVGVLKSDALEG